MKRRGIYMWIILSLVMTGCQLSDALSFHGESENWSAEVVVHKASGQESQDVVLTYLGEDPEKVGAFDYNVDSPGWGTGRGGVTLNKAGVFKDEGRSLNERNTPENAELKITIHWNDQTETFPLKRDQGE